GIRELSTHGTLSHAKFAAWMNKVLNPVLLGGPESPEKVQLDKDSLVLLGRYLRGRAPVSGRFSCDAREAYANVAARPRLGLP
ncbi:MAG: hypothetical protein HY075_03320, partial [Deltaproteobacteria bacterium]|nr:hypothetical protein [Deltaproteobacteria bacterium]